jgi:DNA-directed RNA polymerase II subunit RPB1
MLKYALTNEKPNRPKRVVFGLLSSEDIIRQSVVEITQSILYYRGLPASGGLLDSLMGSVDRRHLCATCQRDARSCQGHSGHIKLAYPVYHGGHIDAVLRVLRCVCYGCSRVQTTFEDARALMRLPASARLQAAQAMLRTKKTCLHCGMPRPTFSRAPLGISCDWGEDAAWMCDEEKNECSVPFTSAIALSILRHIPKEDVELLGFDTERSHPERMIVQVVPVPPPCTRPAIYSSEGSRSRGQNDLTIRLLEVLKRSQEVTAAIGSTAPLDVEMTTTVAEKVARLQFEVILLVQPPSRVPRPPGVSRVVGGVGCKSLSDRLRGKEGRVRGNLMGKRVDFSARCVITPDAYFECDRVGVPEKIALVLTVPEKVTNGNLATLQARVRAGASSVRGAKTVIHADGAVVSLAVEKSRSIDLRLGDVVERFLQDDDVVVFNRQPSLHMHGMQAHRVRLMPGNTFRLSLPTATPYNADFDGDEMNLHCPQGPAARAECLALMSISQKCISAQANKPVMGTVQDCLVGLHILTEPGTVFDKAHACRMIAVTVHCERKLPAPCLNVGGKALYTGHQLFSCLLPDRVYLEPAIEELHRGLAEGDAPVLIRGGRLLCGRVRKSHAGSSAGGVVDTIARELSGVHVVRFLSDAQRMARAFLMHRCHHVGVADVMLSAAGQSLVSERLEKATQLCEDIQREAENFGEEEKATAESAIVRVLGKVLLQVGGIVDEHLAENNAIRTMVRAGSKGSFMNLAQICACLGQQSLEGQRISNESGRRTLPCFRQGDTGLASRGMVANPFSLGLTPVDLFFHGIGGREGLVDTAVKTSQTGYLQRKLNKSMEDCVLNARGHVVTSTGEIVAVKWGGDGMHPARLERNKLKMIVSLKEDATLTPAELAVARAARAAIRSIKGHVLALADFDTRVLAPFNVARVRRRVLRSSATGDEEAVGQARGARAVLELADFCGSQAVSLALIECLNGHFVARMEVGQHAEVCRELRSKIEDAKNVHGESVGCIAAQSVGEPSTQMTLNTFHSAGVATKNVTLGIPRLKELLDGTRNPKTPCVTIRLLPGYRDSELVADYIASTLPLTRLGDLVSGCDIVDLGAADLPRHVRSVLEMEELLTGCAYDGLAMRLELNEELMRKRQLTPPMVRKTLAERTHKRSVVLATEATSLEWFLLIKFLELPDIIEHGGLTTEHESMLIHNVMRVLFDIVGVSGHPKVTSAQSGAAKRMSTREMEPKEERVIHAYGSCLADIVVAPCVDWNRTTSNDVCEVLSVLGIEACAHVLFEQIKSVVSFDGTYVDDRHVAVIVETMTRGGALMSLTRHGFNREATSPLMRCSFEETTDVLYQAALNADCENARCVSTSIMLGQTAHFGTGSVKVMFRRKGGCATQSKPRRRVLRSTRRSFIDGAAAPTAEYVIDNVKPVGPRIEEYDRGQEPTAPPQRKRPRFKPSSPSR